MYSGASAEPLDIYFRYSIVFDAGSTGTRLHVYKFSFCNGLPVALLGDLFKEVNIGISSLSETPEAVCSDVLDSLLLDALNHLPQDQIYQTSVALMATAGLRLLPRCKVEKLLGSCVDCIKKRGLKLFKNDPTEAVSVIDGTKEALWAWIATNFLFKRIGYDHDHALGSTGIPKLSSTDIDTVAVLDLGGASTQIAFEIHQTDRDYYATRNLLSDERYFHNLKFGRHNYTVFVHSFLGYGLIEVRKRVKSNFLSGCNIDALSDPEFRGFPCLPKEDFESPANYTAGFSGLPAGRPPVNEGGYSAVEECKDWIGRIFDFDAQCPFYKCSFGGVPLPSSFKSVPTIYGLSYMNERLKPFLSYYSTSNDSINMSNLWTLTQDICEFAFKSKNSRLSGDRSGQLPFESNIKDNPHYCMDMVYIFTLLKNAYDIDDNMLFKILKKVDGIESSWGLGAALDMIMEE